VGGLELSLQLKPAWREANLQIKKEKKLEPSNLESGHILVLLGRLKPSKS
jgi:hypothetical protein